MKKMIILLALFVLVMNLRNPCVFSLESLSTDQMKQTVARSGVDISTSNAVTENYFDKIKFYNTDDEDHYLSFNGTHIISSINTGGTDMNNDGSFNHLSLDLGSYNNNAMLFADCPDLNFSVDIIVDDIELNNTHMGDMLVDNLTLSSLHLNIGPHVSTGVDFELGLRMKTDAVTYNYNSTGSLTFSGIYFANSFSGAPEDPSSWTVNPPNLTTTDQFRVGDLANSKPATIDFILDPTTDTTSPRFESGFIALNLPMNGSIRVENINFGGNDFGSLAIDGLKVEKLYIEIPGRGLGK
jgi:hypothetical protein